METNQLLINYYKKEEIRKAKERKQNNATFEEIIRLSNKEYITEREIKQALGIEEENQINNNDENEEHEVSEYDFVIEEDDDIQQGNYVMIDESRLEDYPNQPFKLYDKDTENEMIESIKINGIMQPLIVRPIGNDKYQILAGHNRRNCARKVGIKKLPCIIKNNLSDDEAKIYLIDTNLCTRNKISPIERAKAYKIKYDTYKKRNIKTSIIIEEIKKDNIGTTREKIIKEEKSSNGTLQRYLRLNYLTVQLQDLVENGKLSINFGEKISFLPEKEQDVLAEILNEEKLKLTENIIKKIKKVSENYKLYDQTHFLNKDEMLNLIKNKSNIQIDLIEKISIKFNKEEVLRYFSNFKTEEEIKQYILEILEKI